MIIVLEGPDLAGKSTLARALADVTDLEVIHRGPPTQHPLYEYEPAGKWTGICDRWHLGETVYGPLLRGESKLDDAQLWHVAAYLRARGAIVVLLMTPLETILDRYAQRGDSLIKYDDLVRIYDRYNAYVGTHFRDITIMGNDPSLYATFIHNAAHTAWMESAVLRETYGLRTYVGPRHPKVLFVGDKRHHGDDSEFDSAFVPLPDTSGHFLMSALRRNPLSFGLHEAGFMNANECSGDEFYHAWSILGRPVTVALGANAHNKLEHVRIPHGAAPHPQFVRRFHHHAHYEYGELVLEALYTQTDRRNWRP